MNEYERLRAAAKELCEKLDLIHAHALYKSVWTSFSNHGGDYSSGPKYDEEFEKLKSLLNDHGRLQE